MGCGCVGCVGGHFFNPTIEVATFRLRDIGRLKPSPVNTIVKRVQGEL